MQESSSSSSSSSVSSVSPQFCGVALATPAGYSVNVRCPMLATRLQEVANLIENRRDSVTPLAEEFIALLNEQFRDREEVAEIGDEIAGIANRNKLGNARHWPG